MKGLRNIGIFILSAWILLTGLLLLPAGAAEAYLFDEGKRLSAAELSECETRLKQASDCTGMNIAVIIGVENRADLTIESVCRETYSELFGSRTDGLIYYMDLKGTSPYDYIATSGRGQFYYADGSSHNRIREIYRSLDKYLYPVGSENVCEAVLRFAELTEQYYQEGAPANYYIYDDADRMYYHLENNEIIATVSKPYRDPAKIAGGVFFGAFLGFMAAFIVFAVIKNNYKFKSELSPTTYVNRKNVNFIQQYDNFTHTSTSRVHIESSGGHGGHGGGGGHSHGGFGGGGHHR